MPEGTMWDMTAVQAVRLLGELWQEGEGFTEAQMQQLRESTDLTDEEIDDVLNRTSDLWDDIKARTGHGAPEGDHAPDELAHFMTKRMREELK